MPVDYHAWTHRPKALGGTDPIEANQIVGFHGHKTTASTLVSGNASQLTWDEWQIDDPNAFEEGVLSGGRLTDVITTQQGWYAIHCWIRWATQPASGFGGILMIHDNTNIFEGSLCQGVTYPTNFHVQGSPVFQAVRYLPPLFMHDPTSLIDRLEFWAIQNSGVNRTLDEAYCNLAYLGPQNFLDS